MPWLSRQDLELDVAGPLDVLLEVDPAVAERLLGLVAGDVELLGEGNVVVGDAHSAPAAAGDRLDDDRIADRPGDLHRLGLGLDRSVAPGNRGDAGLPDRFLGDRLVAHHLDGLRLGPDELDVARLALLGEFRVLRKEAVARVDRVDVGNLGCADDAVGPQVAVSALGPPDADGLVCQLDVQGLHIGLGIDREGLDAHFPAGANDSEGDFATVGD